MKQGFWIGMTVGVLAAGMVGCVKDGSGGGDAFSREISFGIATESRAVVNAADDMTNGFAVWGHYISTAGTTVDVFGKIGKENTGVTVSNTGGGWNYDGARVWVEGRPYDFHAVYPTACKHVVEYGTDGNGSALSVIGFDASVGEDLLYAEKKGVTCDETAGGVVDLTFHHLLARVEFVAKLDVTAANYGVTAMVTEAKLYGMCKDGTFSSAGFDESNAASITNGWISKTNPSTLLDTYARATNVSVTKDGVNVFGENKDIFVFPGSVGADYHFDVNYTVGGKTKEVSVNLADLAEKTWEPGKVYRYTLTMTAEASLKLTVTVLDWEDESASVSW